MIVLSSVSTLLTMDCGVETNFAGETPGIWQFRNLANLGDDDPRPFAHNVIPAMSLRKNLTLSL